MKQQSLASQSGFEKYGRKSRRELFLDEMEKIVPWSGLEALVRPHYAKAGKGRQAVGLSIMLRVYFVQQWFNLSDPGVEGVLWLPSDRSESEDRRSGFRLIEKEAFSV